MTLSPERLIEIQNRFTYHAPKGDQTQRYEHIRAVALSFVMLALDLTPECREQSLAVTHIEEAVMFFNAAIARRE